MKLNLIFLAGLFFTTSAMRAQPPETGPSVMHILDSVRHHPGPARHFAELYYLTTINATEFFQKAPEPVQSFMNRFELNFLKRFTDAADSFRLGKPIPDVWKSYFADTVYSQLQYHLLGINAHINGDIWQALVATAHADTLELYKKDYIRYGKGLLMIYRDFYRSALLDMHFRKWHSISLGLSRTYGKLLLKHWRKRQWTLATLFYRQKGRFINKIRLVQSKMTHNNTLILRML